MISPGATAVPLAWEEDTGLFAYPSPIDRIPRDPSLPPAIRIGCAQNVVVFGRGVTGAPASNRALEPLAEVLTREELHHHERSAGLQLPDVEHTCGVFALQPGRRLTIPAPRITPFRRGARSRFQLGWGPTMGRGDIYKKPDHFTDKAKKAGFPARSVFKLEEIDRRVRLLKPGMRVLDLGASPGSWALYAAQKIGAGGKLLAMDLNPLNTTLPPQATFLLGDALTIENEDLARFAPYDVVLSDMAPNTTGNRLGDQTRSFELFMRALEVAATLSKSGGAFVGKIFMGEDLPLARAELRKHFETERLIRPEGTRSVSYELFIIGQGRKAGAADRTQPI